jgi:NAD(P)H dehydrogenase (quinone)
VPSTELNVLIVHAHHEPKSLGSALFHHAARTLSDAGHAVVTSDLYAQRFDPVSDQRNFTSTFDADYLKQGKEERHATAVDGFAPDLEYEIRKLESCDRLVFSFPLWWFVMPAILKGWVDRTFAYSRIFGGTRMHENGLGQGPRRAMSIMTTGGDRDAFGVRGIHPSLEATRMPLPAGVAGIAGEAWSPRDGEIAFIERIDDARRALWVSHPDGNGAGKLVEFSSCTIGGVAWTPDGKELLYGALAQDRMQIFAIARTGGVPRQLTHGDVNMMHPSVSPSGLLVAASRIPWRKELWRMKLP